MKPKPATVRPEWKMPASPGKGYAPTVECGGGEADFFWHNEETTDDIPFTGDNVWPFVEELAGTADFEAIGFEVV